MSERCSKTSELRSPIDLCVLECCNKYTVFIIMYIIYCISVIMKNTLLKTITVETEDGGAGLELFSGF